MSASADPLEAVGNLLPCAEGASAIWEEEKQNAYKWHAQNNSKYHKWAPFNKTFFLPFFFIWLPTSYLSGDFNTDLIKHLIDNCLLFLLVTRLIQYRVQSFIDYKRRQGKENLSSWVCNAYKELAYVT